MLLADLSRSAARKDRTDVSATTAKVSNHLLFPVRVSAVPHDLVHRICNFNFGHRFCEVKALVTLTGSQMLRYGAIPAGLPSLEHDRKTQHTSHTVTDHTILSTRSTKDVLPGFSPLRIVVKVGLDGAT